MTLTSEEIHELDMERNFFLVDCPIADKKGQRIIEAVNKGIDSRLRKVDFVNRTGRNAYGALFFLVYLKTPKDLAVLLYRLDDLMMAYDNSNDEKKSDECLEWFTYIFYRLGAGDVFTTLEETESWPHVSFSVWDEVTQNYQWFNMPINEAVEFLNDRSKEKESVE